MHGVRLVRTPPTNTNGSATTGRDESSVVMSGPSMATDYILHHDQRKFPRRKNPCLAPAAMRGEGFLGRVVHCGDPPPHPSPLIATIMAASPSSSQPPRPTPSSQPPSPRTSSTSTPLPRRKPSNTTND